MLLDVCSRAGACLLAPLTLALVCLFFAPKGVAATAAAARLDAQERAFCRQLNALRAQRGIAQRGIAPLRLSGRLTRAAIWMSNDMARHSYVGHVDTKGRSFARRSRAFGYPFAQKGENLAAGSSRAASTFRLFKRSAPHRQNMLTPRFKVIGIARAFRPRSAHRWYWATTFGATKDRSRPC